MTHFVYILQNESTGRYYCGQTDNLQRLLAPCPGARTGQGVPVSWHLVWKTRCSSRREAVIWEHRIKKRGIARYLHDARLIESCRRLA